MPKAPQRIHHASELLDAPDIGAEERAQSLRHVEQVNRWLGGEQSVLEVIASRIQANTPYNILDIGTGNAGLPRAIAEWATEHNKPVSITATDVNPEMVRVARTFTAAFASIRVDQASAFDLPYDDNSFDCAFMSLTLHHFDDGDAIRALREMRRVSRGVVIVSDLERCWMNYLGSRLLAATWWRRNPITRHDGPLSVLRSYTAGELRDFAQRANLPNFAVQRRFFYRLVLISDAQRAAAATE